MIIYLSGKNSIGAFLGGIPLRDLSAEEFNRLDKSQKAQILAQSFYVKASSAAGKAEIARRSKASKAENNN